MESAYTTMNSATKVTAICMAIVRLLLATGDGLARATISSVPERAPDSPVARTFMAR